MFLLPWSTGTASEKVLPKEVKPCGDKARSSSIVQFPLLNKAKRKRDPDESANPAMGHPPTKRRPKQATKGRQDSVNMILDNPQDPSCANGDLSLSTKLNSNLDPAAKAEIMESHRNAQEASEPTVQAEGDDIDFSANSVFDNREEGTPGETHTRLNYRAMDPTTLRQTIESQFNLEILLKHRELRLIDQELAKCQIALEQLRRCHIMPYPVMTFDPDSAAMVSMGTGPTYGTQAQHAPPWGVTDGPYSRHYAKWLIPDPAFDDDLSEDMPPRRAGKGLPRASRGKSQKAHPSASSRAQRGSARERLHALPHGYPEPKENKGPMIVRRSTDGQMVKLVCLDCRREDFSSAQGFINHCRIAHSHGFASHDAAAIACGEEVETDSMGGVVGEANGNHASVALVHPLIRSANLTRPTPSFVTSAPQQKMESTQQLSYVNGSSEAVGTPKPRNDLSADNAASSSFKPSPQTPHLSALFARSGRSGDLDEMVTEARKQPDPDTPDPEDDDQDDDQEMEDAPVEVNGHHTLGTRGMVRGGGRLPARSGMSPIPLGRPQSNKSTSDSNSNRRKPHQIHTTVNSTPYANHYNRPPVPSVAGLFDPHSSYTNKSPADSSAVVNFSPNTIESHPAPSLVSDDGDYDNPHTDSEVPSSAVATDDEDTLDVEVKDHEHHAMDVDEPSGSSTADFGIGKPQHSAPAPRRRAAPGFGQSRTRKPPLGGPRKKGGK